MDEKDRRARLISWLEVIYADVQDLLLDDYIFQELQKMLQGNSRFKECSGLFGQWMVSSFGQATAIGIRRQAKVHKKSASLRRFLDEIKKYPFLISRAHYVSLHAGAGPGLVELGEKGFDRLAGVGCAHLPVAVVQDHICQLIRAVADIEHYVDRRIAHYDLRDLAKAAPTFGDLTVSLKTLDRIVILYWRLLKGPGEDTLLPTIQFDWKDVFRFPWMPTAPPQAT